MIGISIRNEVNMRDKVIGISFRGKYHHATQVILDIYKFTQSNSRFNALDTLVHEVHSVKIPVGFLGIKTNGRPLDTRPLVHLKKVL